MKNWKKIGVITAVAGGVALLVLMGILLAMQLRDVPLFGEEATAGETTQAGTPEAETPAESEAESDGQEHWVLVGDRLCWTEVHPEMEMAVTEYGAGSERVFDVTVTASEVGVSLAISRQFRIYRVEGDEEILVGQHMLDDLGATAKPRGDMYVTARFSLPFVSFAPAVIDGDFSSMEPGVYRIKYVGMEQEAQAEFVVTETIRW